MLNAKLTPTLRLTNCFFKLVGLTSLALASSGAAHAQWRISGADVPQLAAFDTAMKNIMTAQGASSAGGMR